MTINKENVKVLLSRDGSMPQQNYAPHYDHRRMTPKQNAMALHAKGIPFETACNTANYDMKADMRRSLIRWLTVAGLLLVGVAAVKLAIPDARAAEHSEAWFAACLGGATVQVGDQLFQCLPSGKAR